MECKQLVYMPRPLTRRQYAALCAEYNRLEDENVITNKSLFVKRFEALLGRDAVAAASVPVRRRRGSACGSGWRSF